MGLPSESLDHFATVSQDGATWVSNIVPAYLQCQITKGNLLPQEVEAIPHVIEYIALYQAHHRCSKALQAQEIRFDMISFHNARLIQVKGLSQEQLQTYKMRGAIIEEGLSEIPIIKP